MAGQLVYEPRALWSVARVTPAAVNVPVQVQLPKADFRNGERHPIVLEHFLIAPVGYTLVRNNGAAEPPTTNADRHDASGAIQLQRLFITAPGRQHYSFFSILESAWTPDPTSDISMIYTGTPYASGLLNMCRWDFSRPLWQPRGYGIKFDVGGFLIQPSNILNAGSPNPRVRLAFFERGGMFGSSARVFQPATNISRQGGAATIFPFPADGLGSTANPQGSNRDPFSVTGDQYRKRQQSQAGSERLSGFAVHIDALAYEDAIQTQGAANVVGQPIAAEALRMPVTCQTMGGVTDTYWWRPGAPLALVCPTITPAQVYRLKRPIVLHPGDVLDIQAEVPGGFLSGQTTILPTYQFGVSFTGYAIIEG
jgi:hypothetical protein